MWRTELQDRKLRLIHSGRLLADGMPIFTWIESQESRQKKVATSVDDEAQESSISATNATWLHCALGAEMDDNGDNDEGLQVSVYDICVTFLLQRPPGYSNAASPGL